MRWGYSGLLYLATPVLLGYLFRRGRQQEGYRQQLAERFGLRLPVVPAGGLWIHAASVGEVQAMSGIVRACQERYPGLPIIVSTTTPSGGEQVHRLFGEAVYRVVLPFDYPHATARFVDALQPRVALIAEMELWPNLFVTLRRRNVPTVLANARLSAQSARRYAWAPGLMRAVLSTPVKIAAQTAADADRLIQLGASSERLEVTGNLKFDVALPADSGAGGALRNQAGQRRPVWIAASTRAGEEEAVLAAFSLVRQRHPDTLLVLVPRHPDRFESVIALCQAQALSVARRSQSANDLAAAEVLIGDTMGELPTLYAMADIAFVGGSLVPLGGQNVLEPAALGLPVIVGPHTFNFTSAVDQLLACGGGLQVANADELARVVIRLFDDARDRAHRGSKARQLIDANRGAGEHLLRILAEILP